MKSLRWWIIALLMIGSTINYLTRSTLGVVDPFGTQAARADPVGPALFC
jgi:hypothetical protein